MAFLFPSILILIVSSSAKAQSLDASEYIRSDEQKQIWNSFEGSRYLTDAEPALYSGKCYQSGPFSNPAQAQAGLAYFYSVDDQPYYDGLFGSPERLTDYDATSYGEAEEKYTSHDSPHHLSMANESAVADFSTSKTRVIYAFRVSSDHSHLYLAGFLGNVDAVLCDLVKHLRK